MLLALTVRALIGSAPGLALHICVLDSITDGDTFTSKNITMQVTYRCCCGCLTNYTCTVHQLLQELENGLKGALLFYILYHILSTSLKLCGNVL